MNDSIRGGSVRFVGSRRRLLTATSVGIGTLLAGCTADTETPAEPTAEATVTIRLRNRDDQSREYEVVVNRGTSVTSSFAGVLPAGQDQPIEMVATVRVTDEQYDFSINTEGGQRGRTWDPEECGDFLVEAIIENGEPDFETDCRSG